MVRPENELVCPDSSGHTKKGLGNNLAWKVSCWNATIFKSCKLPFQPFGVIGQVLLQFSKFLCSTVYSLLSLAELERWLADLAFFNTNGSIPALKTLPDKVISQTLPIATRRFWDPD